MTHIREGESIVEGPQEQWKHLGSRVRRTTLSDIQTRDIIN